MHGIWGLRASGRVAHGLGLDWKGNTGTTEWTAEREESGLRGFVCVHNTEGEGFLQTSLPKAHVSSCFSVQVSFHPEVFSSRDLSIRLCLVGSAKSPRDGIAVGCASPHPSRPRRPQWAPP